MLIALYGFFLFCKRFTPYEDHVHFPIFIRIPISINLSQLGQMRLLSDLSRH